MSSPSIATAATAPDALVELLAERVPLPLDELELTAVLESVGITDAVARADFGAGDAFALAAQLFPQLRSLTVEPDGQSAPEARQRPRASGVGLLLLPLAPLAGLLLVLAQLDSPRTGSGVVTAVALGAGAGTLFANALLLPVSQRAAVYLGYGQDASAIRFVARATFTLALAIAAVAGTGTALAAAVGVGTAAERTAFALAAGALALLLVAATPVLLVDGAWRLLAAFALGAVVALSPTAAGAAPIFPVDAVVGYAAVLVVLAASIAADATGSAVRLHGPRLARLLRDAAPTAAYGVLASSFLGVAALVAWLAREGPPLAASAAVLAAVLPVPLAGVAGERAMLQLWTRLELALAEAASPQELAARGLGLHRRAALAHALVLGSLAAAAAGAFELAAAVGVGNGTPAVRAVFLCSLSGFALFAVGHFDALFLLGLRCAGPAVRAAAAGAATLAGAAAALAPLELLAAPAALPLGGLVFAVVCRRAVAATMRELDWHYAEAF